MGSTEAADEITETHRSRTPTKAERGDPEAADGDVGRPLDEDVDSSLFADAVRQDGGAVDVILKRGLLNPPGGTSAYSNGSAHLVSAVLTAPPR